LLKRVQKNPDMPVYAEMLIWQYVQSDELDAAYRQAKALDRRRGEEGQRLMQLARMARSQKKWRTAKKCYQYVIEKGAGSSHYLRARMELLEVMNKMVTEGEPTKKELLDLEGHYRKAIMELGRSSRTAMIIKEWAHIKGFYLDRPDSAIAMLRSTIELGGMSDRSVAKCKLELGDQLLLKGNVWDASLYYSQVEKAFKHSPLGHKAKFKDAKIAFYTGDFQWAQAQLNVLKASTSKLIANNAMDLSLLISDNFDLDTVTEPMEMFARAHLRIFQKDHDRALATLDSLENAYPDHSLIGEIVFQRYRIARDRGSFKKAAEHLQRIIDEHPKGILADNALFRLAEMNEAYFDDEERAKELYKRLINEHAASLYVVQARERFRKLRGDAPAGAPK
jgi:outer membrane protein assembly factor BamD (BamD/ComL family)